MTSHAMTAITIEQVVETDRIRFTGEIAMADIDAIDDPALREGLRACCGPGKPMSRLVLALAALLKLEERKRKAMPDA